MTNHVTDGVAERERRRRGDLAADADAHVVPLGRRYGYAVSNNITLIREIIRLAVEPGFVLIGPAERVFTRQPDPPARRRPPVVTPAVRYQADAVAQLLDAGHLTLGGSHTVQYGDRIGPAVSVLVPKVTRNMVNRWDHLVPLRH